MKYTEYDEGLSLSKVCFGTMRFASKEENYDDFSKKGEETLRLALDKGVNFIHSSYQYNTRWLLDKVLKDHQKRHDLIHMIKVVVPDLGDECKFSEEKFRGQIETAMKMMHTEKIHFIQYLFKDTTYAADTVNFPPLVPSLVERAKNTFDKMKDEGKVEYFGCQGNSIGVHKLMVETGAFDFAVYQFNSLRLEMAEYAPVLIENNMRLFPIQPLAGGILTDKRYIRSKLEKGDRFMSKKFNSQYDKIDIIRKKFKHEIGCSMTSFALRFPLAMPIVPSVITSMNNPEQVKSSLIAMEDDDLDPNVIKRCWI